MLSEATFGVFGGVLAGSSLAAISLLSLSKLRMKVLPKPREAFLSDLMQFDRVAEDGETLLTKAGVKIRVIELRGLDISAKTSKEVEAILQNKQLWMDALFEHSLSFKIITNRSRVGTKYPTTFKSKPLQDIHDLWEKSFEETYINRHYLIFSEAGEKKKSVRQNMKKKQSGSALGDIVSLTLEYLDAYDPIVLDNRTSPSELLSFYGSLLGRSDLKVEAAFRDVSEKVVSTPVEFDSKQGFIEYKQPERVIYEAALGIKYWGEESRATILRDILTLPSEITLLHQVKGIPKHKAKMRIKSKRAQQQSSLGKEELGAALEVIESDETSLSTYQFTVFVRGDSREEVLSTVGKISSLTRDYGMVLVREREAIEWLWRCQFPGFDLLMRPSNLLTHNLSHFISFDYAPKGLPRSDWGEGPIRLFKTATGASYQFQFHVSEEKEALGHSVMIAPTGSGKTTLVQHLIGGALRHKNFKAFIFDRLQGTKIFTQSLNGVYVDLSSGQIPLNPFVCEDTDYNRLFLLKFLAKLAKVSQTPKITTEISNAIDLIFQVGEGDRVLTNLLEALFSIDSDMKLGLQPWVKGGGYGKWFNGENGGRAYDALNFNAADVVSFEMEKIQEDEHLASVMTDYIFYKIRSSMMDRSYPHFIFVDEAKAQLADSDFKQDLKSALNQQRKLRGCVCLAFQTTEQINEVGLRDSITTQCKTAFLFPNRGADRESYEMFKLTDAEWEYVSGRSRIAKRLKHSVLVKRPDESVILDINLEALGPHLRLYKSGNEAVQLVNSLQNTYGEKAWIDPYLKAA